LPNYIQNQDFAGLWGKISLFLFPAGIAKLMGYRPRGAKDHYMNRTCLRMKLEKKKARELNS